MKKLELTWIGKDKPAKIEPRILIEDTSRSYGEKDTENMIIHGDNLLALKALETRFSGQVKCCSGRAEIATLRSERNDQSCQKEIANSPGW